MAFGGAAGSNEYLGENRGVKPQRLETCLGSLILLLLVGIAVGIFTQQSRYDEALFRAILASSPSGAMQSQPAGSINDLQSYLPEGMVVLTPGEEFGPETLSEKIDGKAELYLAAGFLSLRTQRFAVADQPEQWLELFVYDMGNHRNAFSVYSTQQRANAREASLAQFAYSAENALFFQQGQYYVEVIGSSDRMLERLLAVGESFTRQHPAVHEGIDELALFPEDSLIPGSIALLAENVFGFDRLSHTFVGRYDLSGTELTAFLAPQPSPAAAKEMASAYYQFLLAHGGEEAVMAEPIPDAWLVKVFDTFEVVFVHGSYLGGVHEAERQDLASALAMRLKAALVRAGR